MTTKPDEVEEFQKKKKDSESRQKELKEQQQRPIPKLSPRLIGSKDDDWKCNAACQVMVERKGRHVPCREDCIIEGKHTVNQCRCKAHAKKEQAEPEETKPKGSYPEPTKGTTSKY